MFTPPNLSQRVCVGRGGGCLPHPHQAPQTAKHRAFSSQTKCTADDSVFHSSPMGPRNRKLPIHLTILNILAYVFISRFVNDKISIRLFNYLIHLIQIQIFDQLCVCMVVVLLIVLAEKQNSLKNRCLFPVPSLQCIGTLMLFLTLPSQGRRQEHI